MKKEELFTLKEQLDDHMKNYPNIDKDFILKLSQKIDKHIVEHYKTKEKIG